MPPEIDMLQFVEKIETLANPQTEHELRLDIAKDLQGIRDTLREEKRRPALRSVISQVLRDSGISYEGIENHTPKEADDSR